jgi:hypothetical protein
MKEHFLSVIDSYFSSLPSMLFSPKEGVRLINSQLIPKLGLQDDGPLPTPYHCRGVAKQDLASFFQGYKVAPDHTY